MTNFQTNHAEEAGRHISVADAQLEKYRGSAYSSERSDCMREAEVQAIVGVGHALLALVAYFRADEGLPISPRGPSYPT